MNTASAPFTVLGGAAVIAGGLIAAGIAHQPSQHLVWMVAYLVLVVGVVQCVLGTWQARLAISPFSSTMVWSQWVVFNLGNASVIAGTLAGSFWLVTAGTILFIIAMAWFTLTVRHGRRGALLTGYRILALVMLVSSLVGLVLSVIQK